MRSPGAGSDRWVGGLHLAIVCLVSSPTRNQPPRHQRRQQHRQDEKCPAGAAQPLGAIHRLRTAAAKDEVVGQAQELGQAIVQYVELERDRAQKVADTYLEQEIWDTEGTFTLETVQTTLESLQAYGDLPPELTVQDVADLSYYDEVVDEIRSQ